MSQILQVFYSLFSALIVSTAIPNEMLPFGSPFLGLFALVPFYIAIQNSKSYKEAFLLSFLHGFTIHLLSSFWLGNFQGYSFFTLGASDIGTGFVEAFMSFFFYFPILFKNKSASLEEFSEKTTLGLAFRPLWFASLYTAWEWVKSTGFLAYPWGTLSMTAFRWPLITQIADITGPYGITFLYAFFSATFAEGLTILPRINKSKQLFAAYRSTVLACVSLLAIASLYGIYEYTIQREPVKTLNAVLVQQNSDPLISSEIENIENSQRLSEEKINEFKENGKDCDLVVWSEAVLSKRFPAALRYYEHIPVTEPLVSFIQRQKTPFIIGAPVTLSLEKRQFGNSAILINKDGEYKGSYQKMHLVPFAELIPGSQYALVRRIIKKMAGFSYGWTPGKKVVLFDIPISTPAKDNSSFDIVTMDENAEKQDSVLISTPICFDDTAAEVCRAQFLCGSEMFMNITNDAWSNTKSAEIQHFVVAHYRAIEYRTTLARSTNAGYTVVINPAGKILNSLPLFEQTALAAEIPVYKRQMTIYAILGNWLPKISLLLAAIYILRTVYKKRKESSETSVFNDGNN